jgi:disulfide bond formation protein DsbB
MSLLRSKHRLVFLIALAAVFAFAFTTSASWYHDDLHSDQVCQFCHAVHLPVLPTAVCLALPEPIVISSAVPVGVLEPYFEPIAQYSPPRAPPA